MLFRQGMIINYIGYLYWPLYDLLIKWIKRYGFKNWTRAKLDLPPVLDFIEPDWYSILGWTGRAGQSGPIFKTMLNVSCRVN